MIFITGASGFVGKSVKNFLMKNNYEVIPIDLRKDLSKFNIQFDNSEENVLIHTAWEGVLGKDRNNKIQDENLNITYKVLYLLNALNIKKLIAFGSQAEYGPCYSRVSEDQPLKPSSYYGYLFKVKAV